MTSWKALSRQLERLEQERGGRDKVWPSPSAHCAQVAAWIHDARLPTTAEQRAILASGIAAVLCGIKPDDHSIPRLLTVSELLQRYRAGGSCNWAGYCDLPVPEVPEDEAQLPKAWRPVHRAFTALVETLPKPDPVDLSGLDMRYA